MLKFNTVFDTTWVRLPAGGAFGAASAPAKIVRLLAPQHWQIQNHI